MHDEWDLVEEPKSRLNPLTIAGSIFVLAMIAVSAAFFVRWSDAPERAVETIRRAWDRHDVVEFEKRVDIEGLSEAVTAELIAQSSRRPQVREQILDAMTANRIAAAIRRNVSSGNDDLRRLFFKPARFEYQKVLHLETEGAVARGSVLFRSELEKRDHVFRITLRRERLGNWRLVRVENLAPIIIEAAIRENERAAQLAADQAQRAEEETIKAEEADRARRIAAGETVLPATSRLPRRELRTLSKVVGFRQYKYNRPGYVLFDQSGMAFHLEDCPAVTSNMRPVRHDVLTMQGVPRHRDCASRPLPFTEQTAQQAVTETSREWVDIE